MGVIRAKDTMGGIRVEDTMGGWREAGAEQDEVEWGGSAPLPSRKAATSRWLSLDASINGVTPLPDASDASSTLDPASMLLLCDCYVIAM